jgi:transposase
MFRGLNSERTPHAIGESVSDMLNWVPAQRHVVRIACCHKVVQVTAPERRLIAGGLATPAPLAQVPVKMYCDHTPPYRQSQISVRHGGILAARRS